MSNDLAPQQPPSLVADFLKELNLPHLLAGEAGKALSRLIGGAVDIPASFLKSVSQQIDDKREARTVVSKAVAEAAAALVKNDPEVVRRAAHSLLAKSLRQQANKEEVAVKTIEILQSEKGTSDAETPSAPIDDDWLNVFERAAESASSERLQDLLARILAGQLRQPRSISLQTLRVVSEIEQNTLELFAKYAPRTLQTDFIPFPEKQGQEFTDLMTLWPAPGFVDTHLS